MNEEDFQFLATKLLHISDTLIAAYDTTRMPPQWVVVLSTRTLIVNGFGTTAAEAAANARAQVESMT